MFKKAMLMLLAAVMFWGASTAYADDFQDIKGHNLEKEMREAIDLEIMKGYGGGKFGADDSVTRAQFSAFLSRALNLPAASSSNSFSDVEKSFGLADYIYAAEKAGLINGYPGGTFRPQQDITREEMAVMIDRALAYEELPNKDDKLNFTDEQDINPNYVKAVATNASYGIIKGHALPDSSQTRFAPKDNATRAHAAAYIIRLLHSVEEYRDNLEIPPSPPVNEEPPEEEPVPSEPEGDGDYRAASISSDGKLTVGNKRFASYDEAVKQASKNQTVILKGERIVKIKDGIVRPKHPTANIANVYSNSNLANAKTYATDDVRFGSEFDYVSSNGSYVEVSYAGTTGFFHIDHVEMIPSQQAANKRNYYAVRSGDLYHYLYNPSADNYAAYRYGKAPTFLSAGTKYYSRDGSTFFTASGSKAGEQDQYFNVLPVKTKTSYTAADLDRYLQNMSPAGSGSPLAGEGKSFIKAEKEYGINALYLMGKAIHESSWGTSRIAQDKKNLFGLNASDSNPYGNADVFNSFEDSIMYAARHINNNYADHSNWRFSGSIPGNKGQGFNVRYASDMFWGQKIAGHMYRADEYLGKKDYNKLTIGKTNTSGLNVREKAGATQNRLYRYASSGHYTAVRGEIKVGTQTWYQVSADHKNHYHAYMHSAYADILSFPK
ncbi:S-layer homology domain-containing protein [Alkalicoccus halolimnae]|uniref:S-layer homology domain-containing protein n=1 Tax=Alkalicoccus halolimnae TaxID=1667239 RepID=A0A5C7FE89_9BACI|nr:S-layer homology domain-containing protein [Alkalicoccus halolimnae]TXF85617.1 S-layer protein [Alkalicoccus halolimnae]